jgi:long-chain acyl-CoA synthetase
VICDLVSRHFEVAPDRCALIELDGRRYSLHELRASVASIADRLTAAFGPCEGLVFGIAMRSSFDWVSVMLAVTQAKAVLLPVPLEFSDDQIGSLLGKASAVFVGDDRTEHRLADLLPRTPRLHPSEFGAWPQGRPGERVETCLYGIIHTSGTTSRPKGVKIRSDAVGLLVRNLMKRVPAGPLHYLSIVPMSLLIEQVLGVFLPLLSGGSLTFMPSNSHEYGARSGNAGDYLRLIARADPNFLYLPPKILEEAETMLATTEREALFGRGQPHIITGGAKIPVSVLKSLDSRGVQVYEAYGLSENSSVISMNHPGHRRIGSAGTFLDGVEPHFVDGELRVKTRTLCAGYYNADDTACELTDGYLHTGDLGEMRDGYLYITGRKKHVIILSTARNISPEWVETVYKESPLIDDIIVFGEGRDEPAAVVLSLHPIDAVRGDMALLEGRLAEFARIRKLLVVRDIDRFRRDYYTVTGRPRRQLIEQQLADVLYA